jgi:hypothetical protein
VVTGLLAVGFLALGIAAIFFFRGGDEVTPAAGDDATSRAASAATPVTNPSLPSEKPPSEPPQSSTPIMTPPEEEEKPEAAKPTGAPTPSSPNRRKPSAPVTPRPTTTANPEPMKQPASPAVEPLPAQPSVALDCQGVSDACASLRSALEASFDRAGMTLGYPEQAEIILTIVAEEVEARQESQFGTLFVVRTYSIETSGECLRFGERIRMPPPETVTFDSRFGADKLAEHSRKVAGDVTERIEAYWSTKT